MKAALLGLVVAGLSLTSAPQAPAQIGSCLLKLNGTRYGVFYNAPRSCKETTTIARKSLLNRWAVWGHKELNNARKNPRGIRSGKYTFRCVDRPSRGTYAMERCAPRGHQEQWIQVWGPDQACGQEPIDSDEQRALRWQTVC
jgi:hypothetical protein